MSSAAPSTASSSPNKRRRITHKSDSSPTKSHHQPSLLAFFANPSASGPPAAEWHSPSPLAQRHSPQQQQQQIGVSPTRHERQRPRLPSAHLRKSREEIEIDRAIAASLQEGQGRRNGSSSGTSSTSPTTAISTATEPAPASALTATASHPSSTTSLRSRSPPKAASPPTSTKPTPTPTNVPSLPSPSPFPSTSDDRLVDCPVCSRQIPFRTIETHVNTCLDSSGSNPKPTFPLSLDAASEVRSAEQAALLRNGAAQGRRSTSCSPAPSASASVSGSATPAAVVAIDDDGHGGQAGGPDPPSSAHSAKMFPISQLTDRLQSGTKVVESVQPPPPQPQQTRGSVGQGSTPGGEARAAPATAFTMLMTPHSEAKQWATADAVEANNRFGRARNKPAARTAPFYKVLEGMPLSVDAFRFGRIDDCQGYFLSHFHSDHYGGLSNSWCHGPVYCSVTTANLCSTSLRVDDKWLRPLPMEVPTLIPDSGGVTVTCIDANHCPGSCLFLFEGPQTAQLLGRAHGSPHIGTSRVFRYLHCGDFRASPIHTNHPQVKGKKLDIIYLDTTYCNPRYCFPAQDQVVEACAELVRRLMPVKAEGGDDSKAGLLKAEEEAEEDWRTPLPRLGAGAQAAAASRSSATATAFKGWLGVEAGQRADGQGATAPPPDDVKVKVEDADADYDDEEPLLEDEDSVLAATRGARRGIAHFEEEEDEGTQPQSESWQAVADDVPGSGEASPVVKKEDDQGDVDTARGDASASAVAIKQEDEEKPTAFIKKEEAGGGNDDDDGTMTSRNWLARQSTASKASIASARQTGQLLVVVGTYTIGKEKLVKAVAQTMSTKVFCVDSRKYRVYAQLEDAELHSLLTRDPNRASVHVTNLHTINAEGLRDMVAALRARGCDFTHAVAFRPTGWTYKPPTGTETVSPNLDRLISWNQARDFGPSGLVATRDSTPEYMIYGVPYSEHSSFFELTTFALSTSYDRIIATVNVGSPTSRAKMAKWFEKWAAEKRKRAKAGVLDGPEPRARTYW